jgi:hypothetical protein
MHWAVTMTDRVIEFLSHRCSPSPVSDAVNGLSQLLPVGDELLDSNGFGLHSCHSTLMEGWRNGDNVNMVLPLARWQGLYEQSGFGLYLHPTMRSPLFVLWSDETGECVCLGESGPLSLLAFICTSERGNNEDAEQDQLNIASRQRYWSGFGPNLLAACADPSVPRAVALREAYGRHCFGDGGDSFAPGAAWGFLGRLQSKTMVPGFVLSAAGFYAREAQFSKALGLLSEVPETLAGVLPGHSWLRWVASEAVRIDGEWPALWHPPDGVDWTFGRRWWNRWEWAWRVPMDPILGELGGVRASVVARALAAAREAAECGDIARAWSLATLVAAPDWTATDRWPRPSSSDWSSAIRIRINCLERSHWAPILNAM